MIDDWASLGIAVLIVVLHVIIMRLLLPVILRCVERRKSRTSAGWESWYSQDPTE